MVLEQAGDLPERIARRLPTAALAALDQAVEVAREMAIPAYLVGGPVRDLRLDLPVDDLDLVFQGDAIVIAERFVERMGGILTRHTAFGTAKVLLAAEADPFHIDFVTARAEEYPDPAALPVVRPATIADDLLRRDFTINTLAIRLDQTPWEMIDLYDGVDDLQAGRIRILHDRSFIDDPTRILRGARFATRLGFEIEPHTRALIMAAGAAGMIERTTPIRILNEVWLALEEPAPEQVFALLDELGVLAHVVPGIAWTPDAAHLLAGLTSLSISSNERRLLGLGLLVHATPETARQNLLSRYPLSSAEQRISSDVASIEQSVERLASQALRPSELEQLLRGLDETALLLAEQIMPPEAQQRLRYYRDVLRSSPPLLTGDDLRAMQIPPGPLYRTLLQGLRTAQLDGEVGTRAAAEAWVRTHRA